MTITLSNETIRLARIALLNDASTRADDVLRYVELGWAECAANAALLTFRYSRAWHELAFSY